MQLEEQIRSCMVRKGDLGLTLSRHAAGLEVA
jgi:hypothetical protein